MKVLLVDDNAMNRKVLRLILQAEGHQTIEAEDGLHALEKLKASEVDAVISDVLMPRMDGYKFTYEVRRNEDLRSIPIVIYSSTYTSTSDEELARRVGADRFVRRPAPPAAILEALADAVRTRQGNPPVPAMEELELLTHFSDRLVLEFEKKNLELASAKDLLSNAYDALSESEKRYRDLVDRSPVGVIQTAPDGEYLTANAAFAAMLGYDSTADVLRGRVTDIYTDPADRPRMLQTFEASAHGKGFEARFQRKDGRPVWLRAAGRVVRDSDGNVERFEAFLIDISEQRLAEQALRASEERYRELIDFSPMGIFETTTGGRFLSVNGAFASMLGYSSLAEVLPLRTEDLYFDATERDAVLQERDRLLTGANPSGRIQAFETRLRKKDGSPVWVRGDVRAVLDDARRVQRFDVFVVDVTQQRRALDALKTSEARYRALMENANDAIFVNSLDGIVQEVNQAAERLVGVSREEIVGKTFLATLPPEDRDGVFRDFRRTIENGPILPLPIRIQKGDGTLVPAEVTASIVEFGGESHVVGLVRDVSERNTLAEQLRLAQKMEAVGQLAGGVAHDFNNLLTAILGYSQLLAGELEDRPELLEPVDEIRKAGERAAGLTRQLLAFSRKQMIEPTILGLNGIVEQIEPMLARLIGEDIEVATRLAPNLGNVRVDAGQMEQVILNLAVNARDAMPRGGRITIETANVELDETYAQTHLNTNPGPYTVLIVSDTGTGMDEETKHHIFEPFFTTKEQGRGTGLGLSTVYGIVKQNGGYIWVYSELGKGTTFKIYFPRVNAAAEPLQRAESHPAEGGSETILLVEDETSVRALAYRILSSKGYSVLQASGGAEAIELARKTPDIDLLLSDMVLPGLGGVEIASKIRELHPSLKVLYTSGYTDEVIVRGGLVDPGEAFLEKPFTPNSLAAKVRATLDAE